MAWRTIVITQHCKISCKLNSLIITNEKETFLIPLHDIETVLIQTTRATITTYAIAQLLERNIKIIYCNNKGQPIGEDFSYTATSKRKINIPKQLKWDYAIRGKLWQQIIRLKISHQSLILKKNNRKDAEQIFKLIQRVQEHDISNCESIAAHMYFPRLFGYEFTRHDYNLPINALLNYGYAIICAEVSRQIVANGYATEFGIHHANDTNMLSLSYDFIEPFRPFVDNCVYTMQDKELCQETKAILIQLLQSDIENSETTIAKSIAHFVRECLHFLSDNNKTIPTLPFLTVD